MKRIGIDARFMLRPLRGIPLYVLRLCQQLPSLNRDYQYFFFINKGYEHNDAPENYLRRIEDIEKNNPNVTFVNQNDGASIRWEQIYLPRLIKKYNIDLLHMPGNRMSAFSGVPTIVTVHDVMEYIYLGMRYKDAIKKKRRLKMIFYNTRIYSYAFITYRFLLKKSSRIVTVSSYSADDISAKLKINRRNITPIHHGVSEEYLHQPVNARHLRRFTLMLGGDSFQKNPQLAIAAWSKVDPILRAKYPLKIIGFCGTESSSLLSSLAEHKLESEVEIIGWVSDSEIVQYFRKAVLFLFPSRYEGFGFPLIQAMASGTPLISTNQSSIPEVLGGVGYQFDPHDSRGFASGIENILSDPSEWQKQSDHGFLRSQQFRWDISAKNHLSVYNEFL